MAQQFIVIENQHNIICGAGRQKMLEEQLNAIAETKHIKSFEQCGNYLIVLTDGDVHYE